MNNPRKAVTIYDEWDATTFLKPCSDEYRNQLIVIYEDAHGELSMKPTPIEDIKKNYSGGEEEFQEMLNQLGV